MQKVLIDITQHPSARPEVVKRALQALWVTPTLRGGDGRVGDGDLEEDGCFFVGYGCLGYEFRSERVVPGKVYADFGETELKELELTKIFVEEVAGCLKNWAVNLID